MKKTGVRIIAGIVLVLFGVTSCATTLPPTEYRGEADPFSEQLDHYYVERAKGDAWLRSSVIGIAASLILTSTVRTLASTGRVSEGAGTVAELSGYGLVTAGAVTGYLGYRRWREGTQNYLETLELQRNYYNLIY